MEEVERTHGLPPKSIARVIRRSGEQGAWAALERGEISAEDFDERFREDWLRHGDGGASFRGGALLEALEKASFGGEVDAGVDALLREMRVMRGVRAVALTNNWRGSISREQLLALEQRFDLVVQSCLAGCRKPEPRIYAHALERIRQSLPGCADVMPHEIAFLDDLGSNLKPARLLGMHTIHVAPSRPLADALLELRSLLSSSSSSSSSLSTISRL